jgi:hypothetical protein
MGGVNGALQADFSPLVLAEAKSQGAGSSPGSAARISWHAKTIPTSAQSLVHLRIIFAPW